MTNYTDEDVDLYNINFYDRKLSLNVLYSYKLTCVNFSRKFNV